jgi:uroporphyrinogen-III synthase
MQVAVLRPAPDNARTAVRLSGRGHDVTLLPLFETVALPWPAPDPRAFDALLLTSANAPRLAGAGLESLKRLPVIAVGPHTAAAAREAGLDVVMTGANGADAIGVQARAAGYRRLLHLAGRDHVGVPDAAAIPVYASEPLAVPGAAIQALEGQLVLLHSSNAAHRFAALADSNGMDRARIEIAALSPAVLAAAGPRWGWAHASATPDDETLVALVHARAIDREEAAVDKAP